MRPLLQLGPDDNGDKDSKSKKGDRPEDADHDGGDSDRDSGKSDHDGDDSEDDGDDSDDDVDNNKHAKDAAEVVEAAPGIDGQNYAGSDATAPSPLAGIPDAPFEPTSPTTKTDEVIEVVDEEEAVTHPDVGLSAPPVTTESKSVR